MTRKSSTFPQVSCKLSGRKQRKDSCFLKGFLRNPFYARAAWLHEGDIQKRNWGSLLIRTYFQSWKKGLGRGSNELCAAHNGDRSPSSNWCIFLRLGGVIHDDIEILGKSGSLTRRKKSFVALHPVFWGQWWGVRPSLVGFINPARAVPRQLKVICEHTLYQFTCPLL